MGVKDKDDFTRGKAEAYEEIALLMDSTADVMGADAANAVTSTDLLQCEAQENTLRLAAAEIRKRKASLTGD